MLTKEPFKLKLPPIEVRAPLLPPPPPPPPIKIAMADPEAEQPELDGKWVYRGVILLLLACLAVVLCMFL